jgi:S-adenosylmethionine:tRNA ribosyltransferase-isomerase
MKTADFDYDLPDRLIARRPCPRRDHSRLLCLRRDREPAIRHQRFDDLPRLLRPGDLLVLNRSRVIPARLIARRAGSGGEVEILLLEQREPGLWLAMVRPGRKIKPGERLIVAPRELEADVLAFAGKGERLLRFETPLEWNEALQRHGHTPLPPYILKARKRDREHPERTGLETYPTWEESADRERYQTVYAASHGASVAAPTAGLHFTPELLKRLAEAGVRTIRVELDVGAGTFLPVETDDPAEHPIHAERFRVDKDAAEGIARARSEGRRVVAVGTTVARVLETLATLPQGLGPVQGSTDLYILPGRQFRIVDALITNFHLPRSTLLMLVSALAGREAILAAYAEAVAREYRFYSYGDAMLIE